jgi:hypothetical protein
MRTFTCVKCAEKTTLVALPQPKQKRICLGFEMGGLEESQFFQQPCPQPKRATQSATQQRTPLLKTAELSTVTGWAGGLLSTAPSGADLRLAAAC